MPVLDGHSSHYAPDSYGVLYPAPYNSRVSAPEAEDGKTGSGFLT